MRPSAWTYSRRSPPASARMRRSTRLGAAGRAGGVEPGPGPVQPALAGVGELLAALPQRQGLLQGGTPGLQLLHHGGQFGTGLLVAQFDVSHDAATVAVNSPPASRRRTGSPGLT